MKVKDHGVVSKVPIQDTRLFTKNYGNSENLNKLLMNEITKVREKIPRDFRPPTRDAGEASINTNVKRSFSSPSA